MADLVKKFTRRLVNYIFNCSPEKRIAAADLLRTLSDENDENAELLDVPEQLRKQYVNIMKKR